MKTKLLVAVLMLTTVAAFAQSERRQNTSNSNGKKTDKVENNKRTSSEKNVKSDTQTKSAVIENSNAGRNERSGRTVTNRSTDQNTTIQRENRDNQNTTRTRTTQSERTNNNTGTTVTRTTTVTTHSDGNDERRENQRGNATNYDRRSREENVGRDDHSSEGVGRNAGLGRNERENPTRENSRTVNRETTNRNMPVDHRVEERRYATTTHVRNETYHRNYVEPPREIEYRRIHNPYRRPVFVDIYWTAGIRDDYYRWYPEYRYWRHDIGSRIETISAYDAYDYIGDVARVYGQVMDVDYSVQADEYYLYIGGYFPYYDFSVVVPGWVAREISRRPRRFFSGRDIAVTGLITIYDNKPEIEIHNRGQIDHY